VRVRANDALQFRNTGIETFRAWQLAEWLPESCSVFGCSADPSEPLKRADTAGPPDVVFGLIEFGCPSAALHAGAPVG
jgi:hypothetical protein